MVDWSLARQVARLAAGSGEPGPDPDLSAVSAEMEEHVAAYTRLRPATPVPEVELVSRQEWAEINLGTMSGLLDPVAERLEGRMEFAGPLAGVLRAGASATLAAEAGLVLGYLSQRVIGQYEVSLLGGESPPRLLFVAPNLRKAVRELDVDADAFHRWICAHELTHVFQFQGVPWLREHLSGILREYLSTVDVRIERGSAGGLPSMPSLSRLVETFREGGLAALVQTREQRGLMERVRRDPGSREAPQRDGRPAAQPLGPSANRRAPARIRRQAAPIRARQALLRRGCGVRGDGRPEQGLGVARGAPHHRGADGARGMARARGARSSGRRLRAPVTAASAWFTYRCSSVYFYRD
jgi:Zincin-like metallopeptidase